MSIGRRIGLREPLLAAAVLLACGDGTAAGSRHDTADEVVTAAAPRPLSARERAAVTDALAPRLTSPDAARYEWPPLAAGTEAYCGLVIDVDADGRPARPAQFLVVMTRDGDGNVRVKVARLARDIRSEEGVLVYGGCANAGYPRPPPEP